MRRPDSKATAPSQHLKDLLKSKKVPPPHKDVAYTNAGILRAARVIKLVAGSRKLRLRVIVDAEERLSNSRFLIGKTVFEQYEGQVLLVILGFERLLVACRIAHPDVSRTEAANLLNAGDVLKRLAETAFARYQKRYYRYVVTRLLYRLLSLLGGEEPPQEPPHPRRLRGHLDDHDKAYEKICEIAINRFGPAVPGMQNFKMFRAWHAPPNGHFPNVYSAPNNGRMYTEIAAATESGISSGGVVPNAATHWVSNPRAITRGSRPNRNNGRFDHYSGRLLISDGSTTAALAEKLYHNFKSMRAWSGRFAGEGAFNSYFANNNARSFSEYAADPTDFWANRQRPYSRSLASSSIGRNLGSNSSISVAGENSLDVLEEVIDMAHKRIVLDASPQLSEKLDELADGLQMSKTAAVRYAVSVLADLAEELSGGNKLFVRTKDNEVRQILIPTLRDAGSSSTDGEPEKLRRGRSTVR